MLHLRRCTLPLLTCILLLPSTSAAGPAATPPRESSALPSISRCTLVLGEIGENRPTGAQRQVIEQCKQVPGLSQELRAEIDAKLAMLATGGQPSTNSGSEPPANGGAGAKKTIREDNLEAARKLADRASCSVKGTLDEGSLKYVAELASGSAIRTQSNGDRTVPDEVVEFFSILADVAVKRAKRNGLVFLQDRLAASVCEVKIDAKELKLDFPRSRRDDPESKAGWVVLLPDTCALLKTTSLERIAGEPEVLAAAVVTDLTEVLVKRAIDTMELPSAQAATVKRFLDLARQIAARTLRTKNFSIQTSDVNLLIDALIGDHIHTTGSHDKVVAVAIGGLGLAMVNAQGDPDKLAATNVPLLLADLCPNGPAEAKAVCTEDERSAGSKHVTCTEDERSAAALLTSLGIKALTAVDASGKSDVSTRIKAAVQLVFAVVRRTIEPSSPQETLKRLEQLEALVLAAIDRDIPRAVSAAARLLQSIVEGSGQKCERGCSQTAAYSIEQLTTMLSSVATYAATYVKPAEGQPAPTPEALRAARTAAIESAIDASTNRSNRHGQWVLSVGLPVGFSMGGQSSRAVDGLGRTVLQDPTAMYPQLSLPLGLAVQRLPGRRHRRGYRPEGQFFFDGFHAMATVLDLGQFVAYDAALEVSKPTWNSFMSLGAQLGWLIGGPSNTFVLAADVRYAPSVFKSGEGTTPGTQPGGALRFGVFVGYYFSLFDFR